MISSFVLSSCDTTSYCDSYGDCCYEYWYYPSWCVVKTLLTSTQWSTAVLAHKNQDQPLKVNVTPPATATLTEIAAMSTGTTHHGAVATTLLTSTQWSTAVLAQACNQAWKVNVTPLIFATLTEIAAMSTGTTHHGAVVKTHHNSTQ